MKLFKKLMPEMIRCDESDHLIWKWHPQGTFENMNELENRIPYGSQLRVRENETAVFFCTRIDGTIQEFFEGPCDVILETEHFPVLSEINTLFSTHTAPIPAEVYFINLSKRIPMRFGVPFFKVNFGNHQLSNIAVRGSLVFNIPDYRKFVSRYGLKTMWQDELKILLKDRISFAVRKTIKAFVSSKGLEALDSDVEKVQSCIAQAVKEEIGDAEGIAILTVQVSAIEVEEE